MLCIANVLMGVQAFTLEKLDSLVVLAYDKKIASGSRRPSSSRAYSLIIHDAIHCLWKR